MLRMRVQHFGTNKYIPLVSRVSALTPQVMVYSAWIFAEHIQLWNQGFLSYGVVL